MSIYRFIAWTTPGLQNALVRDLSGHQLKAKVVKNDHLPSTSVIFDASLREVFPVMHYSTCITHLNILVNRKPMPSRTPKELYLNLARLPLHAFIKPNQDILIKCKVTNPLYNNSTLWKKRLMGQLHEYQNRRQVQLEQQQIFRQIADEKVEQVSITPVEKEKARLVVRFVIEKGKSWLMVQVHHDSLHKHGYKKYVGKAPLPENVASSIVRCCQINEGVVWNPFCGSGTLIISLLQQVLRLPIRLNYEEVFAPFLSLPIFPRDEYEEYVSGLKHKIVELKILGCDTMPFQLNQFFSNVEILKRKYKILQKQTEAQVYPPQFLHRSYDIMDIVQMDYLTFYRKYLISSKRELVIIANPPRNQRMPFKELVQLLDLAQGHKSVLLISDQQWKSLTEHQQSGWSILQEIIQGGQWTKLIVSKNMLATIPEQSQGGLLQDTPYTRSNSSAEKAIIRKLSNEEVLEAKKKQILEQVEKQVVAMVRRKLQTKNVARKVGYKRYQELFRREMRRLNLELVKKRSLMRLKRRDLERQVRKERVLTHEFKLQQLSDEQVYELQKRLDRKAARKSLDLLKRQQGYTIPRWE